MEKLDDVIDWEDHNAVDNDAVDDTEGNKKATMIKKAMVIEYYYNRVGKRRKRGKQERMVPWINWRL